ncbi:hypothetical protein FRC03_009029 [Tulasnella sp. 419]|nr:hypothetical protein FRC03_009029 [Tulasnella sp. 419]
MMSGSPFDGLPTELLVVISLYTIAEENDDRAKDSALIILTHISRRWRLTLLECSYLWSTIVVHDGDSIPRINEWLRRSKDLPLDIKIPGCELVTFHGGLETLLTHTHRWRSLYFYEVYNTVERGDVPQIFPDHPNQLDLARVFPQLVSLTLLGSIRASGRLSRYRALRFKAPLLKNLVIRNFVHDWSKLMVPVGHLTHVELQLRQQDRPYLRDMMIGLKAMTSLQSLKVVVTTKHRHEASVATYGIPLVFPDLEAFAFHFHGNCVETFIWITYFQAPKLKTLDFGNRFPSGQEEDATVQWHVEREQELQTHLANMKLPSLRKIRIDPLYFLHCWHSHTAFILAFPIISQLTIRNATPFINEEGWQIVGRLHNVRELRIMGNKPKDISGIAQAVRANPYIRIIFEDAQFAYQ